MKRIVVIDDHPIVLKMLANVLHAEYELAGESSDGEEGLAAHQCAIRSGTRHDEITLPVAPPRPRKLKTWPRP